MFLRYDDNLRLCSDFIEEKKGNRNSFHNALKRAVYAVGITGGQSDNVFISFFIHPSHFILRI